PSRSRIVFAQSFGRFFGTLAKFNATITVGTRIGPRTVCTALSPSRMGSVIHSSHATGRMWLSPSISSAVATFGAILQNASAGVLDYSDENTRLCMTSAESPGGCFTLTQPDVGPERRMVEPEAVATSPCRIKSPMPVCRGFDSEKRCQVTWGDG